MGDRIIVGDAGGAIKAVSFDGKVIWSYSVMDGEGRQGDPALGKGRIAPGRVRPQATEQSFISQSLTRNGSSRST